LVLENELSETLQILNQVKKEILNQNQTSSLPLIQTQQTDSPLPLPSLVSYSSSKLKPLGANLIRDSVHEHTNCSPV
jgi:hypothetical protein